VSRILVESVPGTDVSRLVKVARKVLGHSLTELRRDLETSSRIGEFLLFGNDHDAVASRLRALLRALDAERLSYRLYELREDEPLAREARDEAALSSEELENLLQAHAAELERQRSSG